MTPADFLPGRHDDMPAERYHAVEALSASGIKKLLRSPAHYLLQRTQPSEPTAAMQFGTLVHLAVLEPDRFAAEVVVAPRVNKRTKAGQAELEAFAQEHAGRTIADADTLERVDASVAAIRAHEAAAYLLDGVRTEVTLMWHDGRHGVPCKARFDALRADGAVVDVKTCADASPEGFGRSSAQFGYHIQAAHYMSGGEHVLDATPRFFAFIAVESEPPHGVGVYVIQSDAIMAGQAQIERAMLAYKDCVATGRWPAYSQEIQPLKMPKWALRENA